MKKLLIVILLLSFTACTAVDHNSPSTTVAIPETATPVISPSQTQTVDGIVLREYDPAEWKLIYNQGMVWYSGIGPARQLWIMLGREIAYWDGNQWVLFSPQDYGLPDSASDMAIAADGTVWAVGSEAISRYQNGRWDVFPIPNSSKTAVPRLAIDPSGMVWVTDRDCDCENSLKRFNGTTWDELSITDKHMEASHLVVTPDGTLWAAIGALGAGRYDGKTWRIYSEAGAKFGIIRIASDKQGNVFSIHEGQESVVKIGKDGSISKIPFDSSRLQLNEFLLRLFIDKQDTLWVNACLKDQENACLVSYKDNRWVAFVNLPFATMANMSELLDGSFLVSTSQGLYQFKPKK